MFCKREKLTEQPVEYDDFSNKVLNDKGVNTNWRICLRTLNPLCCLMPFFYDYPWR